MQNFFRILRQIEWIGLLASAILKSSLAQGVTLAWDASTNTDIAGYKIYYGGASGNYTNVVSVGNVTTATISGLTEGATYYFAATAYNSSGVESRFSNEASYTVPINRPPQANPDYATVPENGYLVVTPLTNDILLSSSGALSIVGATATNGTASIIAGNRVIFTPATNFFGTATIGYTITDGVGGFSSSLITIAVSAVNQPPTLDSIGNISVIENSGAQTVALTGISSGASNQVQTLTVTAISSNTKLIANPSISYTSPSGIGTLSFKPGNKASGAAIITVTVNNHGASNNIINRTFSVAVVNRHSPPKIIAQPTNTVAIVGKTATFKVSASYSGSAPVYQWKFNSINLPLATSAVLTLTNVTPDDVGSYSVTIANSGGQINSSPATLTVYDTMAASLDAAVRSGATYSFVVNGVPGYKYIVQTSTDLVNWVSVQTNTAPFMFVDSNAHQFSQKFYRSIYAP